MRLSDCSEKTIIVYSKYNKFIFLIVRHSDDTESDSTGRFKNNFYHSKNPSVINSLSVVITVILAYKPHGY